MKKLLIAILIILLLLPNVLAAPSLSVMSTDELIKLKTNIQAELMAREEVKSFEVPTGIYEVGVDLPAGTYTITLKSGYSSIFAVANTEKEISSYDYLQSFTIEQENILGKFRLEEGMFIRNSTNPIILTTYTGLKFN